ncbi:hypothetical protein PABG_02468 [Paracoccidioides brasiliensis Pb03]|nr:hypothetical protein PABG_02468 [Paracoccidioides brasiliensis Pb03]
MAQGRLRRSASSTDDDTAGQSSAADAGSEPDCEYETELTDPGMSPSHAACRGKEHEPQGHCDPRSAPAPHSMKGSIGWALHGSLYEDPPDDTDEDLSDVPSDYGRSGKTKEHKLRARDRWQRYCVTKASEPAADPKWSDTEEALREASAKDLHRFWNWVLGKLKRGKKGRKLKRIKKLSSLKSEWKYFQGYYRKVTGNQVSEGMSEEVLRTRDNEPVYIEDMIPFNQTILQTREKRFHLGLQRLLLCFYNMLGLFTVNRESAILNLQYKDLLLSVQRDPHGGPPVLTVDFQPQFIKQYLGMKKLNTFILPEIIYGISLIFSPHVFLFGFLFHAEAFENSSLQSMEDVRKLFPMDGCQEMTLPLKREMDNWYIFCKVDVIDGQVRILRDTPMSSSTLDSQMKSMSEIHGFLNPLFSHQFRYGPGKLIDESGFVSDAGRNTIMNHATSRTFIKYYATRRFTGLEAIMRGKAPDKEFERVLTGKSRTLDGRRPRHLTDEERASVEQHPELQAAIRIREGLADLYARTQDAALIPLLQERQREVSNTRQRLRYEQKGRLRKDFSRKQAVIDIECQLSGSGRPAVREVPRREFEMPPQMVHLLAMLHALPTSDSLEDEWRRRNKAVEAVRRYCSFLEGGPLRGRPKRTTRPEDPPREDFPPQKKAKADDTPSSEKKRRTVEDHVTSTPDRLVCFQCGRKYGQHGGVIRHFRTKHLNDHRCIPCDLALAREMDMRKHAMVVHGVETRPHSIH